MCETRNRGSRQLVSSRSWRLRRRALKARSRECQRVRIFLLANIFLHWRAVSPDSFESLLPMQLESLSAQLKLLKVFSRACVFGLRYPPPRKLPSRRNAVGWTGSSSAGWMRSWLLSTSGCTIDECTNSLTIFVDPNYRLGERTRFLLVIIQS